jgi:NAD(P)H-flavin reductase
MSDIRDALIPSVGIITEIRRDTPDVKTFRVNAVQPDGTASGKIFEHMPGQCAMVSVPGVGEGMFSITSSPTNKEFMEFSIKKCGHLPTFLHELEVGTLITVRGPYGRPFPVNEDVAIMGENLKGQDLLFIAGGIGLAPLRSVINYVRDNRSDYGKVDVVYGSRSKDDLVDIEEIQTEWVNEPDFNVWLTIDREQEGWDGHVGFVPNYAKELDFPRDKKILICGPPIMIKFTLQGLLEQGFKYEQVFTTMELRMKCAIGKCGRCNIGSKYVCKDGPVFRFDELNELTDEY